MTKDLAEPALQAASICKCCRRRKNEVKLVTMSVACEAAKGSCLPCPTVTLTAHPGLGLKAGALQLAAWNCSGS